MQPVHRQRIFPLVLSPMEMFMCTEDRLTYPMAFVIQLDFSGDIELPAFEAALDEALQRHPLLGCLVQPAKRNLPCWVPALDVMPLVDRADEQVPVSCPRGERIDLSQELGLRIWIRQGDGRVRLTLQFHHACCDGIGAYRFIGDLLALYGIRTATEASQKPSLHPLDPTRLRHRARGVLSLAVAGNRAAWTRSALADGYRILFRGGTPLLAPRPKKRAASVPAQFPGICSHTFSAAEHRHIRDSAGRCGAMLNDLLLCQMLGAIYGWNTAQRPWWPGRRVRIMMPVDLRTGEDYQTPAANMTSYTFISRRTSELRDPDRLLLGIRRETSLIKHLGLGKRFSDTIAAACGVPGLLPLVLSIPRSMAAVVLSNVGDPSRRFTARLPRRDGRIVSGNLVLDQITGVPPMRPRTRATFSVFAYDRRLAISLRCDPHLFDLGDTQQLLSAYIQRLRRPLPLGAAAADHPATTA
jgi:hypothetical protein